MYDYSPMGKMSLKCLPIVVSNLLDIFQQKIKDLFRCFEFIRFYVYELLILTKLFWKDHVHKLELTLNLFIYIGLKCDIDNYFFGKTEMVYLGLWVTCDGIKPLG